MQSLTRGGNILYLYRTSRGLATASTGQSVSQLSWRLSSGTPKYHVLILQLRYLPKTLHPVLRVTMQPLLNIRTLNLVLLSCLLLPLTLHAEVVDRVVAVVNDDVITLSEVNEAARPLLLRVTEDVPLSARPGPSKRCVPGCWTIS